MKESKNSGSEFFNDKLLSEDFRLLAKWLETYVSAPVQPEYGFYSESGELTAAGITCCILLLLQEGVFENEYELIIEYGRDTGRFMSVTRLTKLFGE